MELARDIVAPVGPLPRFPVALAVLALALACSGAVGAAPAHPPRPASERAIPPAASGSWSEGTLQLPFENLDGVILVRATVRGAVRDTSGPFVLDTGAGYLALDGHLAGWLGLLDGAADSREVGLTAHPLKRLELSARQMDLVSPVLTVDAGVIRSVTDRPVLGLLGEALFRGQVIRVDYPNGLLTVSHPLASPPPRTSARGRAAASARALGASLGKGAVPVPFRSVGDGKLLVTARVSGARGDSPSRTLTLVLDTGATKTVIFRSALAERAPRSREWKSICGVSAPTLFGEAQACVARVPRIELAGAGTSLARLGMDAVMIDGPLRKLLSDATGEPIHGLLGYSFLKHYRVTLDHAHRIAWFEPEPENWDGRSNEYTQPGLQVERRGGAARVVGVVAGSPAADAGIALGDELLRIDGADTGSLDLLDLTRRMEGEPGSEIELVVRRGDREHSYRLTRRPLL